MMRFSLAFLGLLFVSAATAATVEEDTNAAMMKLHRALLEEKARPKAAKDNHFSRRLAGVDMKHKLLAKSNKLDSMKEAVTHLTAAQENKEDMMTVAEHLKAAISNINTFVNVENAGSRRLDSRFKAQQEEATPITAAEFHQAIQCLAQAAQVDDNQAFFACGKTVKVALQSAIEKANSALATLPTDKLAEILGETPSIPNLESDPAAIASIISKGIAAILDSPDVSASQLLNIPDTKDFMQLIWMVPVSVVWGGFLWMFIGLWTYGPQYGILGSLWFEISWILSGLGCFFDNPLACGIWNP